MRRPPSTVALCQRTMRTRAARGRRGRAILAALHVIAIVLAANLSGVLHELADVLVDGQHEMAAPHDANDEDGMGCPPGCPMCHSCAHAQVPYAQAATAVTQPSVVVVAAPSHETTRPPQREPASIDRPPRPDSSLNT